MPRLKRRFIGSCYFIFTPKLFYPCLKKKTKLAIKINKCVIEKYSLESCTDSRYICAIIILKSSRILLAFTEKCNKIKEKSLTLYLKLGRINFDFPTVIEMAV